MNKRLLFSTLSILVMVSSILTIPIAVAGKGGKGKPKGEPRYDITISGDIEGFKANDKYDNYLGQIPRTFTNPNLVWESRITKGAWINLVGETYDVGGIDFYQGHQYCRTTVYYQYEQGVLPYRLVIIYVYGAEVIRDKTTGDIQNVYDGVPSGISVLEQYIDTDGVSTKMRYDLDIDLVFTIDYDRIEEA